MSPDQDTRLEGQAWLFPGHGVQYVGMGRELLEQWPRARELLARAEALSGLPVRRLCQRGPAQQLRRPEVLEPVLAALSLAHADRVRALLGPPRYVAGYSAGELVALCCAGVLSEEEALWLAVLRGRILQPVSESLEGRMVSISGLALSVLEGLVARVGQPESLALAGRNAPDHGTISGRPELVRQVESLALILGAQVSEVDAPGSWHCPLVAHVVPWVLAELGEFRLLPPRLPFFSSVTGRLESEPQRLRVLLAGQIAREVMWLPIIEELLGRVRTLVEVGPGHFLTGMARSTARLSRRHELRAVERPGGRLWPPAARREPRAGRPLSHLEGVHHG
ncbi:MAG TPA: ACP S-malonyltransferase [Myxococcaceae bacterium]|nr:ACP S-malonyltransferase [Myxococcaceae bacterium]